MNKSRIQNREVRIENTESRSQNPGGRIQNREVRIENTESRSQNPGARIQNRENGANCKRQKTTGWSTLGLVAFFVFVGVLLIAQSSLLIAANGPAKQEEKKATAKAEVKTEDRKRTELSEKEEVLKKEEARLKALKKELDEKIDTYTRLLARMEEVLKSMDNAKGEQYEHLVKAYEAMPNEEAAARLSALDDQTAVKIIVRMKSKKAGTVMAAMDARKAASLTEGMMSMVKKIPTK